MKRKAEGIAVLLTAVLFLGLFWGTRANGAQVNADAEDTGDLQVSGGEYGEDYEFEQSLLTILTDTELEISGSTRKDSILIQDGVDAHLVLNDLTMITKACPLDLEGSDASIYLVGDNVLTCTGENPGIRVPGNASLIIDGEEDASLKVKGGAECAGIGSQSGRTFGKIEQKGASLLAYGGSSGSGIGSGENGGSGEILFTGGMTQAQGSLAADLGSGNGSSTAAKITLDGDVIVKAEEISGKLTTERGILMRKNTASVFGETQLKQDLAIAASTSLSITEGAKLEVPQEIRVTNRGHILVDGILSLSGELDNRGKIYVDPTGQIDREENLEGEEPVKLEEGDILLSAGEVYISEDGYKQNGVLIETGNASLAIKGEGEETENGITLEENGNTVLLFDSVRISAEEDASALTVKEGAKLILVLSGESHITADRLDKACSLENDAAIQFRGSGSLTLEERESGRKVTFTGTLDGEEEEETSVQKDGEEEETPEEAESTDAEELREQTESPQGEAQIRSVSIADGELLQASDLPQGTGDSYVLGLDVDGGKDGSSVELSRTALQMLVEDKTTLNLDLKAVSLELSPQALKSIQAATRGDVGIRVLPFALTGENFTNASAVVGKRPSYDIQITDTSDNEKVVRNVEFQAGEVLVHIPYTASDEEPCMIYVGADNQVYWLEDSEYDAVNGVVSAAAGHFSVYAVAVRPSDRSTETAEGWKKEADGSYRYYYSDGTWAVNTVIDGYPVDSGGYRQQKKNG